MEILQANLKNINIPDDSSAVYKDECAFSFHTPESEGGLLVDMTSFIGFSPEFALLNYQRTGHAVYLNIVKKRVPKKRVRASKTLDPKANELDATGAPKVLGIGVPGGFLDRDSNYELETHLAIVLLPSYSRIELPNIDIPTKVQLAVAAIQRVANATTKQEATAFLLSNDIKESKYARTLIQLDNGKTIPHSGWKCEKCDKTGGLWLNLSDGMILCGRPGNPDPAQAGNGHALEHYQESGFPLVVKLGTITAKGEADVWSYAADEDDCVLDPFLEKHLLHWGIDIKEMKKTEKTVAELEIDMQRTLEWSMILETDKKLSPIYGPSFTGLINLGNSCYMNSVLQVLFTLPEFIQRYHTNAQSFFVSPKKDPVTQDFHCQLAKVARGLLSGDHAKAPTQQEIDEETQRAERLKKEAEEAKTAPPDWSPPVDPYDFPKFNERGIRPIMFKSLIGKGHPEFSTNRQQDALEFLAYVIEQISRFEHQRSDKDVNGQPIEDPSNILRFNVETRYQCGASNQVGYKTAVQPYLTLPVPTLNEASNKAEVEEYLQIKAAAELVSKEAANEVPIVMPKYTLQQCLDHFFDTEAVEDWYSPAIKDKTVAFKSQKLATFPDVLTLHLAKFTFDNWIPKKIQLSLAVPDILDLEQYRAKGLQPDETPLPEDNSAPAPAAASEKPLFDEGVVGMLVEMGIPLIRAQRASHANPGAGVDAAMDWVFSHGEDPDIDTPLETKPKPAAKAAGANDPDEGVIGMVMEMGFDRKQAIKSLKNAGNDVQRAIEWLFSHPEDTGDEEVSAAQPEAPVASNLKDGPSKYQLFAFISHMGTSTLSGHYVCHIRKGDKWYCFNDEKVTESQNPPSEFGYIYFYRRI